MVESDAQFLARVRRVVDERAWADNQRRYAPKPKRRGIKNPDDPPGTQWVEVAPGIDQLEIEPPTVGTLVLEGVASTDRPNSKGFAVLSHGMQARLPVPLFLDHVESGCQPIGDVFHIRRREGEVFVRAALRDHFAARHAADRIVTEGLSALSIRMGKRRLLSIVGGIEFYDQWTLSEVSVCGWAANPDCCFELMGVPDEDRERWRAAIAARAGEGARRLELSTITKGQPAAPDVGELSRRVDALEARPTPTHRGVWREGTAYPEAAFVTHGGSLWLSTVPTSARPGASADWQLTVKKGQAR